MQPRVLWIEGKRAEGQSFIPNVREKGYELDVVPSGDAALSRLDEFNPHLVVLNATSLRSTGKRICRSLRDRRDGLPILLINDDDHSVSKEEICADLILTLPFTSRKLINGIALFVIPWDGKHILEKGPITLDTKLNRVRCQDKIVQLTPQLSLLLKILMKNAGNVMDRKQLFRKVWETEYTGDTRPLDVHISWLRRILEDDPRHPKLLKTLRGVGYRLDI